MARKSVPSTRTRFLNVSRVLLFWYTLTTIFFRCPSDSSSLGDDSPWMCKPYFEFREQLSPYVTPYYDSYAAPYVNKYVTPYMETYVNPQVDKVRPYASSVQTKVYNPASSVVKRTFANHVEPRITQVKDYTDNEWDRTVKPHIDQLAEKVKTQYQQYLKPHVSLTDITLRPYLLQAQTIAMKTYHGAIVPGYTRLQPRAQMAYAQLRAVMLHIIIPRVQWALQSSTTFVTRRIWPTIRILYGQNIEPQLSKISERLTSYRDSKRLEAIIGAIREDEQDTPTTSEGFTAPAVFSPVANLISSIKEGFSTQSKYLSATTEELPVSNSPTSSQFATQAEELLDYAKTIETVFSTSEIPILTGASSFPPSEPAPVASILADVTSSTSDKPGATDDPSQIAIASGALSAIATAASTLAEGIISTVEYPSILTDAVETATASIAPALFVDSPTSLTETQEPTVPIKSQSSEAVTDDLKRWQAKFKIAADRGSEDLAARVSAISERQITHQVAGVGQALIVRFEEATKDAISKIRTDIIKAARGRADDAPEVDTRALIDHVHSNIRVAGKSLKDHAQALRSWKSNFDVETQSLISSASRSTLTVIDGIRDLGLQDIGMRWAGLDHVTYQDWAEYHNLKETFDEWRSDVERVATEHEKFAHALQEAGDMESRGMAVAEDAAKELARLKEIANRKITAGDDSDEFEGAGIISAAAELGQKILGKLGIGTTESDAAQDDFDSATLHDSSSVTSVVSPLSEALSNTVESTVASEDDYDADTSTVATADFGIVDPNTGSPVTSTAMEGIEVAADLITSSDTTTFVAATPVPSLVEELSDSIAPEVPTPLEADAVAEAYESDEPGSFLNLALVADDKGRASPRYDDENKANQSSEDDRAHATTNIPEALTALSSSLDQDLADDTVPAEEQIKPTISATGYEVSSVTGAINEAVSSTVSSVSSSLIPSFTSATSKIYSSVSSFAATPMPSLGSSIGHKGRAGNVVDRAEASSASLLSRIQGMTDGEDVRALTSRLMDEL